MRVRTRLRLTTALALAGLAMIVTAIFAWAVVGKHRLDPDARYAFKVTRAAYRQHALPVCAPPPHAEIRTAPADGAAEPVVLPRAPAPRSSRARRARSRSPPLA